MKYPGPWQKTEFKGSWRWLRPETVECSYRVGGRKTRRALPGDAVTALDFLRIQYGDRARKALGLPAASMSWADAVRAYRARLVQRGNSAGYVSDLLALLSSLRGFVRDTAPADVLPLQIEGWLGSLAKATKARGRLGWARTTNKKRLMVRAFFHWLYRHLRIVGNPVDAVDRFREEKRLVRNITPAEYVAVWAVSETSVRDILDFLLLTGCRIGEAAKMRRADVVGGVWTVTGRKGKNDLRVPLGAGLAEIVMRQPAANDGLVWHQWAAPGCTAVHWPRSASRFATARPGHGFVEGSPLRSEWLCNVLKVRCKMAGVEYFHAHDLRHAAGSWADEKGAGVRQIQALLGHTQLATTLRYTHGNAVNGAKTVQDLLLAIRDKAMQDKQA